MASKRVEENPQVVAKLILDGQAILVRPQLNALTGEIDSAKVLKGEDLIVAVNQFRDAVRRVLLLHHDELPPAAQDFLKVDAISFLTDAEVEELADPFHPGEWVATDSQVTLEALDDRPRRLCFNFEYVRAALEWLRVLEERLKSHKAGRSRVRGGQRAESEETRKIRSAIRELTVAGYTGREFYQQMDERGVPRPTDPRCIWKHLTWVKAYRGFRRLVSSYVSKFRSDKR